MLVIPLQAVYSALQKADLIGTAFIPAAFQPSALLQVEFKGGYAVELGNHLEAAVGAEEPTITFVAEEPTSNEATYALVSIDPDAPTRKEPTAGPWRHWIVGGLKPASLDQMTAAAQISGGHGLVEKMQEALTPWAAPSPGKGTGDHRYLFLLYRETKPLLPLADQSSIKSNERIDRRNFDLVKFVEENGLHLVGANYFLVSTMVGL